MEGFSERRGRGLGKRRRQNCHGRPLELEVGTSVFYVFSGFDQGSFVHSLVTGFNSCWIELYACNEVAFTGSSTTV